MFIVYLSIFGETVMLNKIVVSRAGDGAGCFWLLGAGAAWKKNEEPEPLGKKSQEPEPEPVKISRLLSPARR